MQKEQRPVSLVVHSPGNCPLLRRDEGFSLRGQDLTNPRGGKLCAEAICSVFPRLQQILAELDMGANFPNELLTCSVPGCGASFRMEEPTPVDQSGMFTMPSMRRRTDRTLLPESDPKKRPIPFLKRLTLDLRDELHFVGFERRFTDGQRMVEQGGMVNQLFVLVHGTASVVVKREGEELMIGSIAEGEFFGEYALLTEVASEIEVRAVGDCMALALNRKDFYQLLLKRPALLTIMAKMVAEKFKAAAKSVENELSRGILGKLSMIPLPDLVQSLYQSRRTGSLVIHNPVEQALIAFSDGTIVSAITGKRRGEEAFYRMLEWYEGEFCFEPSDAVDTSDQREGAVALDTVALMMEGMRRVDEKTRALAKLPRA